MEEEQVKSNIGTEYDFFKQAGLDVFIDGNEGQMHHKTMIIDGQIVLTGSYNFSRSAEISNDENVIIIYNEDIAGFFLKEFQRMFGQAQK
jgi:phosphatidylserine/phosphatidylglycerophosphate/cardiolipin synthase-like enzyme